MNRRDDDFTPTRVWRGDFELARQGFDGNRKGHQAEDKVERLIQRLAEEGHIRSYHRAGYELDALGVDFVLETLNPYQLLRVQVKSSKKVGKKFRSGQNKGRYSRLIRLLYTNDKTDEQIYNRLKNLLVLTYLEKETCTCQTPKKPRQQPPSRQQPQSR